MDLRDPALPAASVIAALGLVAHPEGGHYREIWRDSPRDGGRGAATSIHFLLAAGESSHWHRVDADELWVWNAGGPLTLDVSADGIGSTSHLLGPDLSGGAQMQRLVPRGTWQAARPGGAWTLVSCIVAPAFRFAGFELAPPGWRPGFVPL
jgi:predicted cupin superfamily sugar epimerase